MQWYPGEKWRKMERKKKQIGQSVYEKKKKKEHCCLFGLYSRKTERGTSKCGKKM
jgi:hypothetical protein